MDEGETSRGSWWQTVPGILTAIAGTLTALGGLLVTFHQIGLIGGNKEKPAFVSSFSNDTAKRPEATAPSATPSKATGRSKAELGSDATKSLAKERAMPYSVTFPSGTEATLRDLHGESVFFYKILTAQVVSQNTGKLTLKIFVRLTDKGPSSTRLDNDSFRLLIDGVPRAPINYLDESVASRSAKEGDVIFEVPDSAESLVLSVTAGYKGDTADIPITLKKPD